MKRNTNIKVGKFVKLRTKIIKGHALDIALAKVTQNETKGIGVNVVGDKSKRAFEFVKWEDIETLRVRHEGRVTA